MTTAVALNRTNLYSQFYFNIHNLLDDRDNVADPRDPTGHRNFVRSREPSFSRGDDFPLIVVNPANVNTSETRLGDDKTAEVSGEIVVEVWSTDDAFRTNTTTDVHGKGLTHLDAISDDVIQTLNSVANRNTLRANNIGMVKVEAGSMESLTIDGGRFYLREIKVTFNTALLTVSA